MIAVIGAGPAGLMAAEVLAQRGHRVEVFDAMPSAGRKFLMAGKGGMNITHAEPFDSFLSRYGDRSEQIAPLLQAFTPGDLRNWIHGLGIATFVGSSGRVFPTDMKAAPLLRAWLHRLRESGVTFHMRHRWCGWSDDGALCFEIPQSEIAAPQTSHPHKSPRAPRSPLCTREGYADGSPAAPQRPFRSQSVVVDKSNLPEMDAALYSPLCKRGARGDFSLPEATNIFLLKPDATILALGGGSWPQLGSDGSWVLLLAQRGITIAPLRPANCGFDIAWSAHFRERYAGEPLKSITASFGDVRKQGECVVTATGIEGGLIYALSAPLRDEIERSGSATLMLDLLPDWSAERVRNEVQHPRGSRSLSSHLQSRLGLKGVKANLLREVLGTDGMADPIKLAAAIKSLPLKLVATRPLSEAISSAGGVKFAAIDEHLMLRKMPGVFCAGEMLDWEAPTGGYLLSACFASGRAAGSGAATWLAARR